MKTKNSYLVEYKIDNGTLRKEAIDVEIEDDMSAVDIMTCLQRKLHYQPGNVYISQVSLLASFPINK